MVPLKIAVALILGLTAVVSNAVPWFEDDEIEFLRKINSYEGDPMGETHFIRKYGEWLMARPVPPSDPSPEHLSRLSGLTQEAARTYYNEGSQMRGRFILNSLAIEKAKSEDERAKLEADQKKFSDDARWAWDYFFSPVTTLHLVDPKIPRFRQGIPKSWALEVSLTPWADGYTQRRTNIRRFAELFPIIKQLVIYRVVAGNEDGQREAFSEFFGNEALDSFPSVTLAHPVEHRNLRRTLFYYDTDAQIIQTVLASDLSHRKVFALEGLAINGDLLIESLLIGRGNSKISDLRELNLSNDNVSDRGVALLAYAIQAGHLPYLKTISLRLNRITYRGVAALNKAAKERGLISVDLTDNDLFPDCGSRFAQWKTFFGGGLHPSIKIPK